jgi:hypothetical protein
MANREPPKQGRRTCIFCGGTGMSKEHIWARWMTPYLPKDAPNYSLLDVVVYPTHETRKEREENRSAYSGTVKLVCEPCNNGWMSVLQADAKPILLPLMTGERKPLSRKDQSVLSAWIAMFVMVAEFQQPAKAAITQAVREHFKKTRLAPDNWAIWLGVYERKKWAGVTVHATIPVSSAKDGIYPSNPDGSPRPNTHATTIVVGKLYIHVTGSVFPEFSRKQRIDKAGFPVTRVWPRGLRPFEWATDGLTDRQASTISSALIDFYRRRIPKTGPH